MIADKTFPFDKLSLDEFNAKGHQVYDISKPNRNALKVRRITQLISDLSKKPFSEVSIIDLACGEGVYSIECATKGAQVIGIDARMGRMKEGIEIVKKHKLKNICFEQDDIRKVTKDTHGSKDVVLFLGILYHLDHRDIFQVLQNIYDMCNDFVIIDTHIALLNENQVEIENEIYSGQLFREHQENESQEIKNNKLLSSLDNETSFWFVKKDLLKILDKVGFTSILEAEVPFETNKPIDRITLVAMKGKKESISTYPWINAKNEEEINELFKNGNNNTIPKRGIKRKNKLKFLIKKILKRMGFLY